MKIIPRNPSYAQNLISTFSLALKINGE
jgi:hypothetical protein